MNEFNNGVESKKKMSPWIPIGIGCGGFLLLIIIAIIVLFMWASSGPEGCVRMSNDMEAYAIEYLDKHKILNDTEDIIAYYDETVSCDGTEASILTTERVLQHRDDAIMAIPLNEIVSVKHRKESLTGDIIDIQSSSGIVLKIEIAPFNDGESFYNALTGVLKAKGIKLQE